ncbi:MAG TPA: acetylxylan esterase [Methylomirabilota bacterium]|nr:acetylxylan esterase [Methylomirabilota bacterium]
MSVSIASMAYAATSGLPEPQQLPIQASFPDVLTMLDGSKVTTARQWNGKRRPELKKLFEHYMYGEIPPKPAKLDFKSEVVDKKFLDGKATLKLISISVRGSAVPKIDLLLVTPNAGRKPAPTFLAMNFCGNHAVHSDPRIPLAQSWLSNNCKGCTNNHATGAARGAQAGDWPLEQIIDRGYAIATFANADVDSDRGDVSDGVYLWLAKERTGSITNSLARDRGCIAGWAWGFQRCVDYLVTDAEIDKTRIAAVGHSRNGKTALLAAAFDERIALAIPHQAGCGGTGPSRVAEKLAAPLGNGRPTAETIAVINKSFPHWFNAEFKKFNQEPQRLPFDQHCLVALMAPRPVLLSNAEGDQWANPSGQFDVLKAAEPAYKLLKAGGCDASEMPPMEKLVDSKLGYYIRSGRHSMTSGDWMVFVDFADRHFGMKKK